MSEWDRGALGFFLFIVATCGTVIIGGSLALALLPTSGGGSAVSSANPVRAQGQTDTASAASSLARADKAESDLDTYKQVLTRLAGRCSEPLGQLVDEVNATQAALAKTGWDNSRLSILQGLASLAFAASDPGLVNCKTLLDATVTGVHGSGPPTAPAGA